MGAVAPQTEVKERPIIFSGAMVRAILEGRKTQTRRVLKIQPLEILDKARGQGLVKVTRNWNGNKVWFGLTCREPMKGVAFRCSYGEAGERLWVRESFFADPPNNGEWDYYAFTDGRLRNHNAIPEKYRGLRHSVYAATQNLGYDAAWSSPIHMPRWASRITLEIKLIRVERVQEISEADAIAEGLTPHGTGEAKGWQLNHAGPIYADVRRCFEDAWDAINAKRGYSWAINPWVWVIEFKKL